jgi:hypothetical protein
MFGKIRECKIYQILFLVCLGLFLCLLYFSFLPVIAPDSSTYYGYINIFTGERALSHWDPVRGPVLPAFIYIFTFVFGDNVYGFLIGTFIFYLGLLFFGYKIIREITSIYRDKILDYFIWILFVILIIFNPLLIGYYHTMLTEFIATTIALICCFMSYRWINKSFAENRKSFILYTLAFAFLTIFAWFLKQPYVSIVVFPLFVGTLLSIMKIRNIKNVLSKIGVVLFCIFCLFAGIFVWNRILINSGGASPSNVSSGFVNSGMVQGLSNIRVVEHSEIKDSDYVQGHKYLRTKEKEEILKIILNESEYKDYKIYNVLNLRGDIVDTKVLFQENKDYITSAEAFNHIVGVAKEYPILFLDSYVSNYLAMINIYTSRTEDGFAFYPEKVFEDSWSEHKSLGLVIYEHRPIYWWGFSGATRIDHDMPHYEKINQPNEFPKMFMLSTAGLQLTLFQIIFFITPFVLLVLVIKYVKLVWRFRENKLIPLYEMLIVLFGFGFLHILLHVLTGAIVDRYAIVAYPAVLLGMMLLFKLRWEKRIISTQILYKNKQIVSKKILLIIPAFNEAENIVKVCKSIQNSKLKPDFVVINDASKDDTAKICKENNFPVVSLVHNLGIGGAMQTGYKYALQNGYDIAVQFDGDGQHDINYVETIVKPLLNGEAHLCIGSRFIGNLSEFKSTKTRRVGIKIISSLIFLVTDQHVKDPTSGFRAANKDIIRLFAKDYPVEYPEPESIVSLLKKGFVVKELPVEMKERQNGESSIKTWKSIYYMINVSLSILIRSMRKEN